MGFSFCTHNFKENRFLRWLDKCRKYNKGEVRSQGSFSICRVLSLFTNTKRTREFSGLPCQTMVTLEYNMAGLGESAVWGLAAGAEASSIFLRLSVLPREGIILREVLCCWAIRWLSSWHKGSRKRIGQEGLVVYGNCHLSWLMGWAWEAELNLELLKR